MALELGQLWRLARRWWWLVALGVLLGGAAAYALSSRQTPLYSATATLQVLPAQSTGALDYGALATIDVLAETYRQIILTEPVLQPVVEQLSLPYGIEELQRKVSASAVRGSLIVKLSASDPDPAQAATIANAAAGSFVDYVGRQNDERTRPYRDALQTQLNDLQRQIDDLGAQILTLEQGPNAADPAIRNRIDSLSATLDDVLLTYGQLLSTAQTMEVTAAASKTTVQLAAPAVLPPSPYAPRAAFAAVLGGVAGLLVGAGLVVLRAFFATTTVRAESDLDDLAGGPVFAPVINLRSATAMRTRSSSSPTRRRRPPTRSVCCVPTSSWPPAAASASRSAAPAAATAATW